MKSLYENAGNVVRRIYDLRIKGPPVLDVATDFPSAELFSSAWESIRDEALAVAQQMHRERRAKPRVHVLAPAQHSLAHQW